MNEVKAGDWVKIKKKGNPISDSIGFWAKCGGETFKVLSANPDRDLYKLDFRNVYTPMGSGCIGLNSIECVINNNIISLQDELFQL